MNAYYALDILLGAIFFNFHNNTLLTYSYICRKETEAQWSRVRVWACVAKTRLSQGIINWVQTLGMFHYAIWSLEWKGILPLRER